MFRTAGQNLEGGRRCPNAEQLTSCLLVPRVVPRLRIQGPGRQPTELFGERDILGFGIPNISVSEAGLGALDVRPMTRGMRALK